MHLTYVYLLKSSPLIRCIFTFIYSEVYLSVVVVVVFKLICNVATINPVTQENSESLFIAIVCRTCS